MKSSVRLVLLIEVLVNFYIHGVYSQRSPCPGVYEFKFDGHDWYGEITLPSSGRGVTTVEVTFSIAEALTRDNTGHLDLITDDDTVFAVIDTGGDLQYKHNFPISDSLPFIRSIKRNNVEFCSNSPDLFSGTIKTTIIVKHSFDTGDIAQPVEPPPRPQRVPQPQSVTPRPEPRPRPTTTIQPQEPNYEQLFGNENTQNDWLQRLSGNSVCGTQRSELSPVHTIINGEKVKPGEYPWLVALKDQTHKFFCGGSLVTNRHVITAAHCITSPSAKILVELGRHNHGDISENIILRTTANIIINPDFKLNAGHSGHGDIAILTLTEDVKLSDKIKPICIWPYGPSPIGTKGYVAGWGIDATDDTEIEPKKTTVNIVSQQSCIDAHPAFLNITSENTYCAGGEGSGPCLGDSGGGMYLKENNRWYLKGVISTSLAHYYRCNVELYAVYADITTYFNWLKQYLV